MMMMMMNMNNAFLSARWDMLMRLGPWLFKMLFLSERVMNVQMEHRDVRQVLQIIRQRRHLSLGGEKVMDMLMPKITLSWGLFTYLTTESNMFRCERQAFLTLVAWRGSKVLASLEDGDLGTEASDSIDVVLNASNNREVSRLIQMRELALPVQLEPDMKQRIQAQALQLKQYFQQHSRMTVVLHGPPRSGKSSIARELARLLDGKLYGGYDPTLPGECLMEVVSDYLEKDRPLIVVCEEFDVALRNIISGNVQDADKLGVDARNKTGWNTLLDRMNRMVNVVLVLTTNKTRDALVQMCQEHEAHGGQTQMSMLAQNRVHMWLEVDGSDCNSSPSAPTTPTKSAEALKH